MSRELFRRKISVRLHPRFSVADKRGFCPVRLTARWHGHEIQEYTGEYVLPGRPGKNGEPEELWNPELGRVTRGHDDYVNINARLGSWEKDITDAFYRLFDAAPLQQVSKMAMLAELFPAKSQRPLPAVQKAAALVPAAGAFREVLTEWKQENRNLTANSLRKYDQLATMMESWQPDLRPEQVTQKVAKEYQQHLLDLLQWHVRRALLASRAR